MIISEKSLSHLGYTLEIVEEVESDGDNIKHFYDCTAPGGNRIKFDWTPYDPPTWDDFKMWLLSGKPQRISACPLDRKDIVKILMSKGKNYPFNGY